VLLCSDGLWNAVDDKHIAAAAREDDLEGALDRLAERAENVSYPNSDNISAAATRLCADLEVDTEGPEAPTASADGADDRDSAEDAIDAIRRAVRDYHHELDQD
jgi:serine/threonine protein phosphatase PrpC